MVSSRKEIRDSVLDTTRQLNAQVGNLVNDFINLTLNEIANPSWAFPKEKLTHLWTFLRQKTTFTTVASTEDCVLAREIDKIGLVRQTESPIKLQQIPDEYFYRLVPDPTAEGNPKYYRLWETEGVATRLAAADTIDVVSSSASDAGSAELVVSVSGYSSGIWRTETFTLNGTTAVTGSITFDANREIIVTKQKATTGSITVTENSGGTTLVVLGPNERAPKFKVISLYPIPDAAITMYVEYYTRIPMLNNDSDVPIFDSKWHWVVRLGALAKMYQYLTKENDFAFTQKMFADGVRSMVYNDKCDPDLIEHLHPMQEKFPLIHNVRSEDAIA